ncbi:MAG: helix-hairpin-helix domain-containing protein [Bacteroidales bacterium]
MIFKKGFLVFICGIFCFQLMGQGPIYQKKEWGAKDSLGFRYKKKVGYKKKIKIVVSLLDTIMAIEENPLGSVADNFILESMGEESFAQYMEERGDLQNNPINLNMANEEDLQRLHCLSIWQIEALLKYRQDYGRILGIHELFYIQSFNKQTIECLKDLVCFEELSPLSLKLRDVVKYGKSQLLLRYGRVLKNAKAYSNGKYLGAPDRYYLRYTFNYADRLLLGFSAEKDPGEPFFKKPQKGFDFYTAYLAFGQMGIVKKWIIGTYQLSFGQGLHIGLSNSIFSSSNPDLLVTAGKGLKPYASSGEYGFLKGSAVTLNFKSSWDLSLFYSNNRIDAGYYTAVNKYAEMEDLIKSMSETGYHRTLTEMGQKQMLREQLIGGCLEKASDKWKIGALVSYTSLGGTYSPIPVEYASSVLKPTRLGIASIYYQVLLKKTHCYGELALSWNGGVAVLQGVQWKPHARLSLILSARYYSSKYHSYFTSIPSRVGSATKEYGLETRLKFLIYEGLSLETMTDFSVKDPASAPSLFYGRKWSVRLVNMGRYTETYIQYAYQNGLKRKGGALRVHFSYNAMCGLFLRSRLELRNWNKAYLIYQDIGYDFQKVPLSFRLRFALFDIKNYDNRIFAYESDVLYAAGIPAYFGRGYRFYIVLKYKPFVWLNVELKGSYTFYDEVCTIGSGNEEINGNVKPELKVQIRFKF